MDPFLGEVRPFAFNFAPTGWAFCNGQLIPISQNTALFSLLGTSFGGNGQTTFALPNLQGQVAIGVGQGPGLSDYVLGEVGGQQTELLSLSEMPMHSHSFAASSQAATTNSAVGKYTAKGTKNMYGPTPNTQMEPSITIPDGGGQPHNNMQPYLSMNYCIATQGVFPSRP